MDNADLIEEVEVRLLQLLLEAHQKGLSYEIINWLIGEVKKKTELRAVAEKALAK